MPATWYLIANGSTARLFTMERGEGRLTLVREFDHPESRLSRKELKRDRPGLFCQRGGRPGTFVGATDAKRHESEVFARQLAEELALELLPHTLDRLVLVAPAGFSAILSGLLPPVLRKRIAKVIRKDYTKSPEKVCTQLLRRTGPVPALGAG
ncbi:MAG: host attachment protein [Candidatus Hydrogenedentes bacterium]|nr:host attachment protein [Candidatus Hydrogenedentota bacterium]